MRRKKNTKRNRKKEKKRERKNEMRERKREEEDYADADGGGAAARWSQTMIYYECPGRPTGGKEREI